MARFLLDTNIFIYYLNNQGGEKFLEGFAFFVKTGAGISVITRIEVLGWKSHTDDSMAAASNLLGLCVEYPLVEPVVGQCIRLRKSHRIKLPDAMIAASALVSDSIIVTCNIQDFNKIPGLKYLNPFDDAAMDSMIAKL